jgi:hypothetical protein
MMIMIVAEPRVKRTKVQREPRRHLNNHSAVMAVDDGTKLDCVVLDVSPGGAKIVTDAAIDIGGTFSLTLVPSHPKRQQCEVVWRRGKTYGVKFVV